MSAAPDEIEAEVRARYARWDTSVLGYLRRSYGTDLAAAMTKRDAVRERYCQQRIAWMEEELARRAAQEDVTDDDPLSPRRGAGRRRGDPPAGDPH